ncbi:DUF4293 domain-containing protein [Flaviaesturariibacter aridisoli]|uniref:DUF4293 family protein n=1 Tax=Flaviaesturariibacter aridisoli TaxID=2545761 RepID=A0A4R4E0Y1_9BACT|nr:DUF4293 domain-containing protein [Flaviaesturariibacter aridisoli]TCZ67924.1 DUF4293 family protein [Flaviaesturariibacter aridisoli]
MLQRIQSIWLLLAGAFTATTFRFPFYAGSYQIPGSGPVVPPMPMELNAQTALLYTILTAIICGLAFVTIFLYGNRKLQLRFSIFGLLLSLGLLALYFVKMTGFVSGTMALSSIFYFAVPLCFFLAIRGVVRDEKLIRSMDRLR